MNTEYHPDGSLKVHLGDEDDYEVTDDNGVDIVFSHYDLYLIAKRGKIIP